MPVAFLDVHYAGAGARAACVLAESWDAAAPVSTFVHEIADVEPYQPGAFYRRELPCLLAVLSLAPALPDTVVVDGYVWLPPGHRPGLGAHLYEALGRQAAVVGIAKSAFAGVESSPAVMAVLRGASRNPLFVTAAGLAPEIAAQRVRNMAGEHRIPDLVRLADRLSRSGAAASRQDL